MNTRKLYWLLFFVILGLYALFSFLLINRPLWLDEVNTVLYIERPWQEMIELTQYDFSPPLYYIILKAWVNITNNTSEWALRIPSMFFGITSAIVFFFFSKKWFSLHTAIASLGVFFSSFSLIYYFFEVRMYSLVVLLALTSTYFLFQLLFTREVLKKQRYLWWIGFFLTSVAGVYTHYAYWFFVAGQNLVVLLLIWKKESAITRLVWLASQLFLVISYIPWWKIFFTRIYDTQFSTSDYWTAAAGVKSRFFVEDFILSSFIPPFETNFLITTIIKLIIITAITVFFIHTKKHSIDFKVISIFILGVIPVIFLWLADIHLIRYVVMTFPFFILFVCFSLIYIQIKKIAQFILCTLIILSLFSSFVSIQQEKTSPVRAWPLVTKLIEENSTQITSTAVVVPYVLTSRAFEYYYRGNFPVFDAFPPYFILNKSKEFLYKTLYIGTPIIKEKVDIEPLKKNLEPFQEVWLVDYSPDNEFADPKSLIPEYLSKTFEKKQELFPVSSSYELRLIRFVKTSYHKS